MNILGREATPVQVVYGDADPDDRARISSLLADHESVTVEGVESIDDLLDFLGGDDPVDCVVSAGSLDDGSGLDLLRAVRERDDDLPVVLYPTEGSVEEASEATAAGVTVYLPRTLDDAAEALLERITDAAATYDRRREVERKNSMFVTLMENLPLSIYFKDAEGRHVCVSTHSISSTTDEVVGKTDVELYGDEIGDQAERSLADDLLVVETGDPIVDKEERHVTDEGEVIWLRTTKVPWRNADGEIEGVAGVTREITEVKEREHDLEQEKRRLEQFASFVSHDLRNPISIASGYLDLARETGDEAAFDEVELALERMSALIDDLLSMARRENGELATRWVPLADLVRQTWESTDTQEATLRVEIPDDVSIKAGRGQLRQLFENVFKNAIEHAGVDVEVAVGLTDTGFYVEDDGPGIDADDPSVVFEYGHTKGGSGIGLAITREIAEAHSWTAVATEGETGGARFEFNRCLLHTPALDAVTEGDRIDLLEETNVGNATPVGESEYDEDRGVWRVSGGGSNFWGDIDEYYAVHGTVSGDVRVVARLTELPSVHEYSKAGILACGAPAEMEPVGFVGMTSAHGLETLWRTEHGADITTHQYPEVDAVPHWFRLDRIGRRVTGYVSTDGEEWTLLDQNVVDYDDPIAVGLAVCSHNPNRRCTATFDEVRATTLEPED